MSIFFPFGHISLITCASIRPLSVQSEPAFSALPLLGLLVSDARSLRRRFVTQSDRWGTSCASPAPQNKESKNASMINSSETGHQQQMTSFTMFPNKIKK